MKKLLFILLVVLINGHAVQAQITNPDTMVHRLFGSLKAKDEKAFVALYPNMQQMQRIMTKMFTGIKAEMAKKKAEALPKDKTTDSALLVFANLDSIIVAELEKATSPESLVEMKTKFAKDFQSMIDKGEKRGIDWTKTEMVNYTFDTASLKDSNSIKVFGSEDYKSMKGVVHFKAGDSAYQLSFNQVMFIPEEGGWYGVRLRQLAREGEVLANDEELEKKEIELSSTVEDEPPPPPPPPKMKKKTKSKKAKAKQ